MLRSNPSYLPQESARTGRAVGYDVIVVGSGLGGTMCALPLVASGFRVLMIERGDWVPRDLRNRTPRGTLTLTPFFQNDHKARLAGRPGRIIRSCAVVGGQAVFFGGAVPRFREADFLLDPEIVTDSGARWPFGYEVLEPFYGMAERALDVAGAPDDDPTGPPRSTPYPQAPAPWNPVAHRIAAAARSLHLHPATLPLAINYRPGPRTCTACGTCDSYACALGAKNDPAAALLPSLLAKGLALRPRTIAVHLETRGDMVTGVVCYDTVQGCWVTYRARAYALAAGTLATPHLLLASAVDRLNPAGHAVGRYLMRHCNAVVFGVFPSRVDGNDRFHKQLCIFDYYFGHREVPRPHGKLGVIQQIHPPPPGLLRTMIPPPLSWLACSAVPHIAGLVVIAEDQPRADNRLTLDHGSRTPTGQPQALVFHRYTQRDLDARQALTNAARRILRRAGAVFCYVHPIQTFTHAVGTVRMGDDPDQAPLDSNGQFRGLANLFVTDGSALPTSAGVNPGLTIAANALRVGTRVATLFGLGAHHGNGNGLPRHARLSGMRMGNAHSQ